MFAQSLNTYATPVPTVFNSTLSSAFENAKFTLANGPNDLLTLLGNKATVTADANTTLVQNRDCTALILNTANRVYTLPPLAGQVFPILIEKTSNNFFTITVNRNAAPDTIENPFEATAVPVNTSLTLKLPGEAYLFIPSGTYWRVVTLNFPKDQLSIRVSGGTQAIGSSPTILTAATVTSNPGSLWNTATSVYTALYTGYYNYSCFIDFTGGLNWSFFPFVNAAASPIEAFEVRTAEFYTFSSSVYLTAGQTLDLRLSVASGSFNVFRKNIYINLT